MLVRAGVADASSHALVEAARPHGELAADGRCREVKLTSGGEGRRPGAGPAGPAGVGRGAGSGVARRVDLGEAEEVEGGSAAEGAGHGTGRRHAGVVGEVHEAWQGPWRRDAERMTTTTMSSISVKRGRPNGYY